MSVTRLLPKLSLVLVIAVYIFLAFAISRVTPFNKGNDEGGNLHHIEFIIKKGRLSTSYEERAEIGHGANMPALVHLYLGWLGRALNINLEEPPRIKIFWDSFRYRALDIEAESAWYLLTEDQFWPYYGIIFILQLGRWSSILINAGTILIVFAIAIEMKPQKPWLAVAASALLAFTPTFIFMSSVLNEDAMVALTMAIYLWMLVRVIKQPQRILPYWIMGLALGVSITAKYTAIIVPLEVLLVLGIIARHYNFGWVWLLKRVFIVGIGAILASGWWFTWNIWYLNDVANLGWIAGLTRPFLTGGVNVTMARMGYWLSSGQMGVAGIPEEQAYGTFIDWAWNMALLVWGVSVGKNISWFPYIYLFIFAMVGAAAFGMWKLWRVDRTSRKWLLLMIIHLLFFLAMPLFRFITSRRIGETAQGRHLLIPAAAAVVILLVWGVASAISKKWHRLTFSVIIAVFIGWTVAHVYRLATFEALPLPMRTLPQAAEWLSEPLHTRFNDEVELVSYQLKPDPNQAVLYVDLAWLAIAPLKQSYLLEVSLYDAQGEVKSYWRGYNGGGRVPILAWEPDDVIFDRLGIPIPNLPAGEYKLSVQLLNQFTGTSVDKAVNLPVTLNQQTSFSSNRQTTGNITYSLWQAGGPVEEKMPVYRYPATISILTDTTGPIYLVDETNNEIEPTQSLKGLHTFVIGPRWKSGNYRMLIPSNSGDDALTEPILSVENWWKRQFNAPEIETPLEANFADQVNLLGYYLPDNQVKAGDAFPVTLYWQAPADKSPQADFTQFNNLLDSTGKLSGGYDRYPLEYYNTLLWTPGEVVVDGYTVPVNADAKPGEYYLDVGFYLTVGESAVNLPLIVNREMTDVTSVSIGPLQVVE